MSDVVEVKVEKRSVENWGVRWNGSYVEYDNVLPMRKDCWGYDGQPGFSGDECLANKAPEVQSAVRKCWEEKRPLADDEVRYEGTVYRFTGVRRRLVTTNPGTFFTIGEETGDTGVDERVLAYHKSHYVLKSHEYRDPETGLIKDLAEDEAVMTDEMYMRSFVQVDEDGRIKPVFPPTADPDLLASWKELVTKYQALNEALRAHNRDLVEENARLREELRSGGGA